MVKVTKTTLNMAADHTATRSDPIPEELLSAGRKSTREGLSPPWGPSRTHGACAATCTIRGTAIRHTRCGSRDHRCRLKPVSERSYRQGNARPDTRRRFFEPSSEWGVGTPDGEGSQLERSGSFDQVPGELCSRVRVPTRYQNMPRAKPLWLPIN